MQRRLKFPEMLIQNMYNIPYFILLLKFQQQFLLPMMVLKMFGTLWGKKKALEDSLSSHFLSAMTHLKKKLAFRICV